MKFEELREQVMQMESQDCRRELAVTLELLDQLETHFEWVCESLYDYFMQDPKGGGPIVPVKLEHVLKQRDLL